MKKPLFIIMVFMAAVAPGSPLCWAHGGGRSVAGQDLEMFRIDLSARHIIQDYLAGEYRHHCSPGKDKDLFGACHLTVPVYTGEVLPRNAVSKDLPEDILKKIGFVPAGAVYAQVGYTVYMLGWPDKVIYDSVTLEKKK